MAREKTVGGIKEEVKDEFHIRKIRGKFPNHNSLMVRLIKLFDKYNDQYEAELQPETETPTQ
jgi:hypothetical protein